MNIHANDPYYRAYSEVENCISNLVKLFEDDEFYEKNVTSIDIVREIERCFEMYSVLRNILKSIRRNPETFTEINEQELENREHNLKRLFDKISYCREKVMDLNLRRKESEFQKIREANRNYLLASSIKNDCIVDTNSNIIDFNENISFIDESTSRLQKVAQVISQEIKEQNKIIEDISFNVENESK